MKTSAGPATVTFERDASITGRLTLGSNVTLSVANGATLTVPDGATLDASASSASITNSGTLIVYGTVNAAAKSIGGTIKIAPGADQSWIADNADVSSTDTEGDNEGIKGTLDNDKVVKNIVYLESDVIVPEGIKLTVEGLLDLNGKTLTVYGTLNVSRMGQIQTIETADGGKIVLGGTGAIVNNGAIGYNSQVKIADQQEDAAEVILKNVVGLSFWTTKEIADGSPVYILTVDGEASVSSSKADNCLSIDGAYIADLEIEDIDVEKIVDAKVLKGGSLAIGSRAVVEEADVTVAGGLLDIEGTVETGTFVLGNGTVAEINGTVDGIVFKAPTGSYDTYDDNGKRQSGDDVLDTCSIVVVNGMSGFALEVTSKAYTEESVAMTEQMLSIYGEPELGSDKSAATISIDGDVYVPAGAEFVLGKGMSVKTGETDANGETVDMDGTFVVLGQIESLSAIDNYSGAEYSIKAGSVETYYYCVFDAAYSEIGEAVGGKIVLKGGYQFSKEYTIAANQSVVLHSGDYTISKNGRVDVLDYGVLDGAFVSADAEKAAGIQGILFVMSNGSCRPAAGSYEVSSKDADGNMTYSGAAVAIENAAKGSTIEIKNPVTFSDKTTVPADVTVKIPVGSGITAKKGLVVNGDIVNEGSIDVTNGLEVTGTIDNTSGSAISADKAAVTGMVIGEIEADEVNAAVFDSNAYTVYSSLATAAETVAAMDSPSDITVFGTVKETADVSLSDGMKLVIGSDAVLVAGTVRLVAGSSLEVYGTLTADIVGEVGKAGSTADASIEVSSLETTEATVFSLSYNESTTVYAMAMKLDDLYTGSIVIRSGEVSLDSSNDDLKFGEDTTLTVASGTTLILNKDGLKLDGSDASKKYLVIDGALSVKKSAAISNAVIGGKAVVDAGMELTLNTVTVAGDVVLSEAEGKDPAKVIVSGKIYVGTNPGTLGASGTLKGKIDLSKGYAIVFSGSTFQSSDADVKHTKYVINGIGFATAYGTGKIVDINDDVVALANIASSKGDDGKYNFTWMSGAAAVADSDAIGKYAEVSTTIAYTGIDFEVSIAPGISVFIDDKEITGKANLAIGTHRIVTYILPSYTGTVSIALNGKTVTGGEFQVTNDMLYNSGNKIVLTGVSPAEPVEPVVPSEDSSGTSLTDILLIVLVVLIAAVAVMVAIRLMRS